MYLSTHFSSHEHVEELLQLGIWIGLVGCACDIGTLFPAALKYFLSLGRFFAHKMPSFTGHITTTPTPMRGEKEKRMNAL